MHKAEDPVNFYLSYLLAIRKAQGPCPQRKQTNMPRPPKSCRFRSCDVNADQAFLVLWASSIRRSHRKVFFAFLAGLPPMWRRLHRDDKYKTSPAIWCTLSFLQGLASISSLGAAARQACDLEVAGHIS
ncbi:hypothetical protein DFO70_112114 [Cytobacillus firmus]|uniref:Uncharacterized protein n=2 Tax=Cytobacillus TaxID=2675230 RepID=A0A366JMH7_CYTFI|nr:hypothetical protein DFO70_112114 [Cytobacillus firmus]TDX47070.1 hypothetical protein DFO72_101153 [Cytobacillus oceanisediminis]